jgi:hypothetical protein
VPVPQRPQARFSLCASLGLQPLHIDALPLAPLIEPPLPLIEPPLPLVEPPLPLVEPPLPLIEPPLPLIDSSLPVLLPAAASPAAPGGAPAPIPPEFSA